MELVRQCTDGLDIKQLGLGALRRGMYMVPQEPVMFQGTIRTNIDIESLYSDADIWVALKHCGLEDYVSSLPEKLDAPVEAEGANFSLGQKQALSLVPAVLSRPKVNPYGSHIRSLSLMKPLRLWMPPLIDWCKILSKRCLLHQRSLALRTVSVPSLRLIACWCLIKVYWPNAITPRHF